MALHEEDRLMLAVAAAAGRAIRSRILKEAVSLTSNRQTTLKLAAFPRGCPCGVASVAVSRTVVVQVQVNSINLKA